MAAADDGALEASFAAYLEENRIGEILRSLMTALSVERPDNVLDFLHEQTLQLQNIPDEDIEW